MTDTRFNGVGFEKYTDEVVLVAKMHNICTKFCRDQFRKSEADKDIHGHSMGIAKHKLGWLKEPGVFLH
jgi:hypothetical protein